MAWSGPLAKWSGEHGCLVPGRTTEASLEFAGDRRVSYRASILQRSIKSNNHGRRNAQNRIRSKAILLLVVFMEKLVMFMKVQLI